MPGIDHCLEDPQIRDISMKARARYANIMYDTAFKLVFGSEANKSLLIELLEALIPGKKISDVTFHDKEIPGYFVGDKKTVFDLFCTTERKESFIVEMQLHGQRFFTDRVLFYSTYPGADCHAAGGRADTSASGSRRRELEELRAETELSVEPGLHGQHPEFCAAAGGIE